MARVSVLLALLVLLAGILGGFIFTRSNPRVKPFSAGPPVVREYDVNTLTLIPFTDSNIAINGDAIVIDSIGTIYSGTESGKIVKIDPATDNLLLIVDLTTECPRSSPIGIDFYTKDNEEYLIVADAQCGILRIHIESGGIEILVPKGEINLPNDVIVSRKNSNIIFFTDSCETEFENFSYMEVFWKEYLLFNPSGKVWKFDQNTKELELLERDLGFPKGIVLTEEEDLLLVSNSLTRDIIMIPLENGKRQGVGYSYLLEYLHFHPAGLSRTSLGFLVTNLMTRQKFIEEKILPYESLRAALLDVPYEWIRPYLSSPVGAYFFNLNGNIVTALIQLDSQQTLTSAAEFAGKLFFGSISENTLAFYPFAFQ